MRTNIDVDDTLVADAMRILEVASEREAVEQALQTAIQLRRQRAIRELRGIGWDGDLEDMRLDKPRPSIA